MQQSSGSIGSLATALARAQAELINPEKSMVASIRPDDGTAEQIFRYAPLSSPRRREPFLAEKSYQQFNRSIAGSWCRTQGCSAVSVTITPAGERRHGLSQFYARRGFAQSGRMSASATLDA